MKKTWLSYRPKYSAMAMCGENQTEQPRFMVKSKGSNFAEPNQGILALDQAEKADQPTDQGDPADKMG